MPNSVRAPRVDLEHDANDDRASTIAIIGAGAAGILSAVNLLGRRAAARIVLLEGRARFGPGVAYSTQDDRHLLNVPAGKMSAYVDAPDHFVDWLVTSGRRGESSPGAFVPRRLYADYLNETLAQVAAEASEEVSFERMWGEATAIVETSDGYRVDLADWRSIEAIGVVLAIGPPPSGLAWPGAVRRFGGGRYLADPWEPGALDVVQRGSALLVGTGLTMVDVALVLARRGVELHAVSRHGLVPLAHSDAPSAPVPANLSRPSDLRELVRVVRHAAAEAEDAGGDWRAVVDGLRPVTQTAWQELSVSDQARFLRHVRRHWDAHRHRLAPEVGAELTDWLEQGQLHVRAATVLSVTELDAGLRVQLRERVTGQETILDVDHIVNCTGPGVVTGTGGQPLVRSLVEHRLAVLDPHDLGVLTAPDGALLGENGSEQRALFALGALRRGMLWESTAIPELRAQAALLADSLHERLCAVTGR